MEERSFDAGPLNFHYADSYSYYVDGPVTTLWFGFLGEWLATITLKSNLVGELQEKLGGTMAELRFVPPPKKTGARRKKKP